MSNTEAETKCERCGLPFATEANVEEAHSSHMNGNGICWYGAGSAYSVDECRTPPAKSEPPESLNVIGACVRCGGWVGKRGSRGPAREDTRCTRDMERGCSARKRP